MYKASDIAHLFINLDNNREQHNCTNYVLNKLLYYAQGWSLALNDKPLFKEDIEAWQYGPVVRDVYSKFSEYGTSCISLQNSYSEPQIDPDTINLVIDIFSEYGDKTFDELLKMTHKKGSPWEQTYTKNENKIISNSKIKEWFQNQKPLRTWKFDSNNIPRIGNHDAEGHLVLPKEWNDD